MGNGDYVHDYKSLLNYSYMSFRFYYVLREGTFCGLDVDEFERTVFHDREAMQNTLPPKGFEKYKQFVNAA